MRVLACLRGKGLLGQGVAGACYGSPDTGEGVAVNLSS